MQVTTSNNSAATQLTCDDALLKFKIFALESRGEEMSVITLGIKTMSYPFKRTFKGFTVKGFKALPRNALFLRCLNSNT